MGTGMIALWLGLWGAEAAQIEMPMAELWGRAEAVVEARISRVDPFWDESGGISSEACLSEVVALRGQAPMAACVHLESGQIGEHQTVAEDEPRLLEDRRYLLFLVRDDQGRLRILGGERGAWVVRSERSPRAPSLDERLAGWKLGAEVGR
jgi:hypothetical protein